MTKRIKSKFQVCKRIQGLHKNLWGIPKAAKFRSIKIFKQNIFLIKQKKNRLTAFGRYLNTKQIIKHFYCNIDEQNFQKFMGKFYIMIRKMNHLSRLFRLLYELERQNKQRRLSSSTQKNLQLKKKYVIAPDIAKQGRIQFNQDNIIGLTSSKQGRIQREQDTAIELSNAKQGSTQAMITQPSSTPTPDFDLFAIEQEVEIGSAIEQESDSSFAQCDTDKLRESSCYEIAEEIVHLLDIDSDSLRLKLGSIEKKTIKKPPITKQRGLTLKLFIEKFIHNVYISSVDVAVTNNLQSNEFVRFETSLKNVVNSTLFLGYEDIDIIIYKSFSHLSFPEIYKIRRKIVKVFSQRGFPKKRVWSPNLIWNSELQTYWQNKKSRGGLKGISLL